MPPSRATLLRLGTALLRYVPYAVSRRIAVVAADVCCVMLGERRRTLERNLAYTAPAMSSRERKRTARETFRKLALCSLDFLRVPWMSAAEIISMIDASGRETLDAALAEGRGVVLVTAHLGNYELGGAWLAALGYPVYAVAEDLEEDALAATARYREATGLKTVSRERGAVAAYRALTRNAILALVADRAIGGGGVTASFCSGRRPVPTGPASLALRSGAPIVVAHLVLREPGATNGSRYICVMDRLTPPVATGADAALNLTRAITDKLAEAVRRYPDQWFVFQPEWIVD